MKQISKGRVTFVQKHVPVDDSDFISYDFPAAETAASADPFSIIHHPDEVCGFDKDKLVLGVVSPNHNVPGISFQWLCDGESVSNSGCICAVDKPGNYHCKVTPMVEMESVEKESEFQEVTRDSKAIQVVKIPSIPIHKDSMQENPDAPLQKSRLTVDFHKRIFHGSFGDVFRGTCDGKAVAVKRIKMKRTKRPDKMILKEANLHKQLDNKNIVKFIGTYMDDSNVFIVTELVQGQDMEDMIHSDPGYARLSQDQKVNVATDLLIVVAYLHEHDTQIIHEDIKPSNVLITSADLSAKRCDLGLAKVRSFDVASTTTTALHTAGTPEYMSPEILLSREKASTC